MPSKKSPPSPPNQVSKKPPRRPNLQFRITEEGEADLADVQAIYGLATQTAAIHLALRLAARPRSTRAGKKSKPTP